MSGFTLFLDYQRQIDLAAMDSSKVVHTVYLLILGAFSGVVDE